MQARHRLQLDDLGSDFQRLVREFLARRGGELRAERHQSRFHPIEPPPRGSRGHRVDVVEQLVAILIVNAGCCFHVTAQLADRLQDLCQGRPLLRDVRGDGVSLSADDLVAHGQRPGSCRPIRW